MNILTVPTFELKAFLTLSKGKPTAQDKHADGSTFDLGYLQAVTRYFKDAKCPLVNVTYPQKAFEPIQWEYGGYNYNGLLMPIRR